MYSIVLRVQYRNKDERTICQVKGQPIELLKLSIEAIAAEFRACSCEVGLLIPDEFSNTTSYFLSFPVRFE